MAEPTASTPTGASPERHRRADPELYRIAYAESQRALEDQRDELNGLRTRATSYVALVGSATGFLVGTSVKGATRDTTFHVLATLASVSSVLALASAAALLIPQSWNFRLSASTLIDHWIEPDLPGPTVAGLLRGLANRYDKMRLANETSLAKLRRIYFLLIISGGVGIFLWALLAVLKA